MTDDAPEYIRDIVHAAHGDNMPDETIYELVLECAESVVSNCNVESTEDDLRDTIGYVEPDVYTADLTAWLARRVEHVYYISEALENYGSFGNDGFALLQWAQQMQIDEVGNALLDAVIETAGELENEEE